MCPAYVGLFKRLVCLRLAGDERGVKTLGNWIFGSTCRGVRIMSRAKKVWLASIIVLIGYGVSLIPIVANPVFSIHVPFEYGKWLMWFGICIAGSGGAWLWHIAFTFRKPTS